MNRDPTAAGRKTAPRVRERRPAVDRSKHGRAVVIIGCSSCRDDDAAANVAPTALHADYAPEPHEPPNGHCAPFATSYSVYSPTGWIPR